MTVPRIFGSIFLALPMTVQPSNLFALPVLLLFFESIIADLISRCLGCCLHAGDGEYAWSLICYLSCPHFYLGDFCQMDWAPLAVHHFALIVLPLAGILARTALLRERVQMCQAPAPSACVVKHVGTRW